MEEAAEFLKEMSITSINIDCSAESELCSDYGITSYPAMRIFRGPDNYVRYRGKRKASKYVSF
jgi:protein disulfide-isomerase A1